MRKIKFTNGKTMKVLRVGRIQFVLRVVPKHLAERDN